MKHFSGAGRLRRDATGDGDAEKTRGDESSLNPSHKDPRGERGTAVTLASDGRHGRDHRVDRRISAPNSLSMLGLRRDDAISGRPLSSAGEDVVASSREFVRGVSGPRQARARMRPRDRGSFTRQPKRARETRPAASTVTPSRSRRRRCVMPELDPTCSRLSFPCALMTRCQGSTVPVRNALRAYPTRRAWPSRPARRAIAPYVVTRPRGILRTAA